MKKNKYTYQLQMTKEQAAVLERALEFYTRIRNGQFQEILYELRNHEKVGTIEASYAADLAFQLRSILFRELGSDRGASYGVGHDHKADVAWDIYQTIRYTTSWHEHPEGGIGVNFHEPLHTSSEPLPSCQVIQEERSFRDGYLL